MEKAALLRVGVLVLVVLAVLTAVEYWVAVGGLGGATLTLLALLALAKAALIVDYFMHVGKLFQPESGGH
ncbi:MAG: cytochrome C oxidase subunit IV family protein [Chloroflexi bacterium]|nr:cytochrome C oxidase subunit IV family protein [Chloroflexota bacterium]